MNHSIEPGWLPWATVEFRLMEDSLWPKTSHSYACGRRWEDRRKWLSGAIHGHEKNHTPLATQYRKAGPWENLPFQYQIETRGRLH